MRLRTLALGALALAGCNSSSDAAPRTAADAPPADAVSTPDAGACIASTAVPDPRGDAVGAVDPETGFLWIVGGDVGPTVMCRTEPAFRADVWSYDPTCDRWTEVALENGPAPRARAAAALDTRRRRLVLFGGRARVEGATAYMLYRDVWALDLAAPRWERLASTGGPSARANATAVYDPAADELVVFGGSTSTSGTAFTPQADTWALNLETRAWRRVATSGTAPSARLFHAAAVRDGRMLVVSGGDVNAFAGPFLDDAYALDLASGAWSAVALTGDDPGGRINHALVADPAAPRFVLLAGHDDGALGNRNDVLAVAPDGAVSTLRAGDAQNAPAGGFCVFPADFVTTDVDAPERRSAMVVGVDPQRRRALVFGGKTDCGSVNDVWSVDLTAGTWHALRTTNQGVSCERAGRADCTSLCN